MPIPQNKAFDFLRNMPRYFWLLLVIFTITFGVLFLDHFRTYSSQVTILIVHKNEKTAGSAEQVVYTIAELPKTLSFYNRLLKQFPEVKDPWVGMSDDERRNLWLDRVSVEQIADSGLIRLQINADTASDASLLAQKSAMNLFQIIGKYYNIRTEIDIRTIDPLTSRVEITHPWGWFLASLSAGFIVATLVSFGMLMLSQSIGRFRFHQVLTVKQEQTKSALVPVSFDAIPQEKTPLQNDVVYQVPTPTKAPNFADNLPFLEEGMSLEEHLFGFQDTKVPETKENTESAPVIASDVPIDTTETDDIKKTITTEPTAEELKRRLNQLLKGDM